MKRFIRTIAGKTVLFIICIISLCLFIGSAFGAYSLVVNGFYTQSKKAIYDDIVGDMILYKCDDVFMLEFGELDYDFENAIINSNIIYQIQDEHGKVVAGIDDSISANKQKWYYSNQYTVAKDGNKVVDVRFFDSESTDENSVKYTLHIGLKDGLPENDDYLFETNYINIGYSLRYMVYVIVILALFMAIASFITLMRIAGRKPGSEELHPGPLNRIPFDLIVVACVFVGILLFVFGIDTRNYRKITYLIKVCICCLVGFTVVLGLCMSTATRIKQKTLLKNTVICYCMKLIHKFIKKCGLMLGWVISNIPFTWRTLGVVLGLSMLEYIIIMWTWHEMEIYLFFWFLEKIVLIPAILYVVIMLRKLQKAGESLAIGNLSYHLDTKGLLGDFKRSGENLNNIASGMSLAVEERLKSERMKTELITNVSHDIKTPLTSIINYATLIGNETCENEKITEYSSVLLRQSERLKRLIEDLVEASKASTGNLEVLLSPCDPSIFLTQAGGEYEEKLQRADLTLITKQLEQEVRIMADGRRMWRVFDNLMNNICKYAQSGTRVYLTLEILGDNVVITFKNTSREPLDISAEELMERFVRGDASRNTEGNGLGLSIAKSMTELQNGSLNLLIDGDLFKVTLAFPIIS